MIERAFGGGAVEIQGAAGFGCEYPGQRPGRGVDQNPVLQRSRQVEDAPERTLQAGDATPHVLLVPDIARDDVDFTLLAHLAQCARAVNPVHGPAALGIAVHQGEVTRPGGNEVGQEPEPEAAQPAGHEIGGVRVEERAKIGYREARIAGIRRCRQDQFALVSTRGHQPQRPCVVAVGEYRKRQWRYHALVEQIQAGPGKLVRQVRIVEQQTIDVDRGKAEVLAEHAHAERVVGVDVHLPDLTVPPGVAQGLQAEGDVVAGQRIQDDVDALAAGGSHQVVVPVVAV